VGVGCYGSAQRAFCEAVSVSIWREASAATKGVEAQSGLIGQAMHTIEFARAAS